MTISKMLLNDLCELETKYERKTQNARTFSEKIPTETNMRVYENCYRALNQVQRLRAVFERTF
jgi:division protein CdvB (Snf7/Vps24/ESCRT-III family)